MGPPAGGGSSLPGPAVLPAAAEGIDGGRDPGQHHRLGEEQGERLGAGLGHGDGDVGGVFALQARGLERVAGQGLDRGGGWSRHAQPFALTVALPTSGLPVM
jgi:hypothetical protein